MRKLFSTLLIVSAATIAFSQGPASQSNEPPNQGLAPKVPNGVGRADVRVFDQSGMTRP